MLTKAVFFPICVLLLSSINFISCSDKNQQAQKKGGEMGRVLDYAADISFIRSEGDTISTVEAAIADNNRLRSEGLMNVMHLPDNAGMLFIFENEQARSFWMANTPLPLDIIFVNSEMTIVRIHRNTQPYSQESIQSEEPAKYVVEVNAGYTLEHDIREGMQIAVQGADL